MIKEEKNRQMKILVLTHTYSNLEPGGEPKIVYELTHALARADVKVYVVAPRVNIDTPYREKNLTIYQAPFCRKISVFNQGNMLKAFLFALPLVFLKRIDLIHLMPEPGPCPFVRFKIRPLAFSSDMPWNYNNPMYGQDLYYDQQKKSEEKQLTKDKNLFFKLAEKMVDCFYSLFHLKERYPQNIDLYTCTSHKLINELKLDHLQSKFLWLPWGVNPKIFNSAVKPFRPKSDNFTFLFMGTLGKRKGVEYLIKAFKKIYQDFPGTELILVGNGAFSTVAYFKELGANTNIHFIDCVLPVAVPSYLNAADVFILPSLGEPFGLANLEAMACGKPVISTNDGGVPDYFKDKEIGFLIRPADVDDLYEAMKKFIVNRNLVAEMGEGAKEYVTANLTWDAAAIRLIPAYYNLIFKY